MYGKILYIVAPYVGVWIETDVPQVGYAACKVAPYVGVWIETPCIVQARCASCGRTLCGCVD